MRRHHRAVAITTPLIALALIVFGTLGASGAGPRTEPPVAEPHGRAERTEAGGSARPDTSAAVHGRSVTDAGPASGARSRSSTGR